MARPQQVVAGQVKTVQLAPQAPAAPATTPPPGTPVAGGQAPQPGGPATESLDLSKYNLRQLRQMLQELRSQRSDYASRYSNLGDSYEKATGANQAAMGERLTTVGNIIVRYENEMARVGGAIVARGGESTQPTESPGAGWMRGDDAAGMAFGFSFMTMLLTFFLARRFFRRKYAGAPPMMGRGAQPANLIASNERLERIEQAVDSIAIEVERVSENQRFMTRLMTETQLGENLKDIKRSAELAKSAAEAP